MEKPEGYDELEKLALEAGFTHAAPLDCDTLELKPEVREMCAANACGMYGRNKACPPACGTLEECRGRIAGYHRGVVLQTVGEIEDSFDFEAMMETEAENKKHLFALVEVLKKKYPDLLPLGSGCCTVCKECAGPDAPCRFPEKRISSLEAYGIVVNELCSGNGLKYNYGSEHIAYTCCCLID